MIENVFNSFNIAFLIKEYNLNIFTEICKLKIYIFNVTLRN